MTDCTYFAHAYIYYLLICSNALTDFWSRNIKKLIEINTLWSFTDSCGMFPCCYFVGNHVWLRSPSITFFLLKGDLDVKCNVSLYFFLSHANYQCFFFNYFYEARRERKKNSSSVSTSKHRWRDELRLKGGRKKKECLSLLRSSAMTLHT